MEIVRTILPHDVHEIDGKLRYFDNNALVPQVPLCEALNSTCDLIYQMLVSRGNVTAEDIRGIPDWVFALAVELKWIPKPFDPDEDLPAEEGRYWRPDDDMLWLGYDLVLFRSDVGLASTVFASCGAPPRGALQRVIRWMGGLA